MHILDECDSARFLVDFLCRCVIVLTWILKTKYGVRKLLAIGVYVVGLILAVFFYVDASDLASKNLIHYHCNGTYGVLVSP